MEGKKGKVEIKGKPDCVVERINETKLGSFFTINGEEKKFPILKAGCTISYKTAINDQENYVVIEVNKKDKGINKDKTYKAKICPILSFSKFSIEYDPLSDYREIILDPKIGWNFSNSKYQYGRFEYDIIKKIPAKYESMLLVDTEFKVIDDCVITKIPIFQVGNAFLYTLENSGAQKIYVVTNVTNEFAHISRVKTQILNNKLIYNTNKKIRIPLDLSFKDLKINEEFGSFKSLTTESEDSKKKNSGCFIC